MAAPAMNYKQQSLRPVLLRHHIDIPLVLCLHTDETCAYADHLSQATKLKAKMLLADMLATTPS